MVKHKMRELSGGKLWADGLTHIHTDSIVLRISKLITSNVWVLSIILITQIHFLREGEEAISPFHTKRISFKIKKQFEYYNKKKNSIAGITNK